MRQDWNPRFVLYARAHGVADPQQMLQRDGERYPGGKMAGFLAWMSERWQEWCLLHGKRRTASGSRDDLMTANDHDAFDAWLSEKVGQQAGT